MRALVWSATFIRAFKRAIRRQPELRARIEQTLRQMAEDPFHPTLHSHKLKGELAGSWACTVDYDHRILFEFVQNPESGEEEILLLTIGTHDEVY
ncbi:MAG: type II toxin-antitoxin system YafQ family toxin [Thermoflexales bacterium]|nr:type II toxin-antitoxin system YafQ family toxin [Thermoflexales bacterium]